MSYLNLVVDNQVIPGPGALGISSTSTSNSNTNTGSVTSKITVFGLTILTIYAITKILNFYGIGADKYGSYLMFYVFLILCASFLNAQHAKL